MALGASTNKQVVSRPIGWLAWLFHGAAEPTNAIGAGSLRMLQNTRATLLNRLRDGTDTMAWDEFYGCYWPVVFSYARHRGCSEHTAQEIVQDVMLTVFEQRDVFHYDPTRGRFRNWLHRVVNNRVAQCRRRPVDRIRAQGGDRSDVILEPIDDHLEPDAAWDVSFDRAVLTAMVQVVRRETNPRDFVAFELAALHDRSPNDVARLTGLSRNMVYKARRKVLQRLRQLAGDYADEGRLCRQVREALESLPNGAVQRSLTGHVSRSMQRSKSPGTVGSANGS